MANPYDTPPEVDDDGQRPEETDRGASPTQQFAIALLLGGIACELSGKIAAGAYVFVLAAIVLAYDRFVGDR